MTLQKMATEYSSNTAILEIRIIQLELLLRGTRQFELRRRLKKRIGVLHAMVGESRRAAYDLEHYYDKGGAHEKNRIIRRRR